MPLLQGLHLQTITLYTRVSAGENPGLHHPAMPHRMYQKPNHWHITRKEDSRVLIRGSPFRGCIWSRMQNKWKHLRCFSPCDVVARMYTYVTPCYFLLHLNIIYIMFAWYFSTLWSYGAQWLKPVRGYSSLRPCFLTLLPWPLPSASFPRFRL